MMQLHFNAISCGVTVASKGMFCKGGGGGGGGGGGWVGGRGGLRSPWMAIGFCLWSLQVG